MARKSRPRSSLSAAQLAKKQLQDQLYNIRKRYQRQAKKLQQQASKASGEYRRQLLSDAQAALQEAERYKFSNVTKGVTTFEEQRKKVSGATLRREFEAATERKETLTDKRKDEIARNILKGAEGKNFYAATRQLWEGVQRKVNEKGFEVRETKDINDAIMRGLGVSNTLDAIQKISEATGYDFSNDNEQLAWQMYANKTVIAKGERYVAGIVGR